MQSSHSILPSQLTLGHISLGLYILSITLLPLGFGGNRDIPFGISQTGLALSALILIFEQSILHACYWPKRIKLALALFCIVLVWGGLQTQSFMPQSWHHPLWQEAGKQLQSPIHGSIALWRDEAFFSLNRLVTYITAGVLAYIFAGDASRARLMLQALWYSGIALCFYGYLNIFTGSTKVLWVDKTQYQYDFTSTFVSKNHFAIYAALVLLSGCALLYQSWRNMLKQMGSKHKLKEFGAWLKDKGISQLLLILYVFGAIILSHCRSGLILAMMGIGAFFVCYQLYAKEWTRAVTMLAISLVILISGIMVAQQSSEHFAQLFIDQSSAERLSVYDICINAIRDNPLLGYGLGSFQAVYRLYNETVPWSFNRAHSDALESLVDLGIPAGLILWSAILLLISGVVRGLFKRRRHGLFPAIGIAASLVVILHSAMDFSLQIPGVAMPFAMIMGLALAQSWGSSDKA